MASVRTRASRSVASGLLRGQRVLLRGYANEQPQVPRCRPLLDRHMGLTKDSLQELLAASGASHADDDWSPARLGNQLEGQEGATFAPRHNQFRYKPEPLAIAGNVESIPI